MRDYKELIEALRSFANSYVQMFGKGESSQLMNAVLKCHPLDAHARTAYKGGAEPCVNGYG